jgi:hypothetical protein
MTYLDLTSDIIAAPSKVDLDTIAAVMLWPNDSQKQIRAVETSAVELLHSIRADLGRDDLLNLASRAKNATPLSQLQEELEQDFNNGVRAGFYLRETVGGSALGNAVSMKRIAHDVGSLLSPKISGKTFENTYWPVYRAVSHYWAAHIDLAGAGFPCAANQLLHFLRLSEGYRELGERTRTKQSPRRILFPGETISLDPLLKVEPFFPEFELK